MDSKVAEALGCTLLPIHFYVPWEGEVYSNWCKTHHTLYIECEARTLRTMINEIGQCLGPEESMHAS